MMKSTISHIAVALCALSVLSACQTVQRPAFQPISAAQQRQLDSRWFDTKDEVQVLNAIVSVYQDLGFNVDETDVDAGLVSASKGAEKAQYSLYAGRSSGSNVRATSTTRLKPSGGIIVRTTFQAMSTGKDPRFYRLESKGNAQIYQQFYDKLEQSLFLEAQQI